MPGTPRYRSRLITLALPALCLLIPACSQKEEAPEAVDYTALTARIAEGMVEGVKVKGVKIAAERYDDATGRLIGVHVDGFDGVMSAAWAEFATDRVNAAIQIILHDVTIASSGSKEAPGMLTRHDTVRLDPMPVADLLAEQ